jgi:hypothetical protein
MYGLGVIRLLAGLLQHSRSPVAAPTERAAVRLLLGRWHRCLGSRGQPM